MKSDFVLKRLPPITDVPIVEFMKTLNNIYSEYNNTFLLWLTIVIVICSVIVASFLIYLLICLKYVKIAVSFLHSVERGNQNHQPLRWYIWPLPPILNYKEEFRKV